MFDPFDEARHSTVGPDYKLAGSVFVPLRRLILLTAGLLLSGCGSAGPDLVPVSGTVTLDGKPLANAHVTFEPHNGASSIAMTNSQGEYSLVFPGNRVGALPGEHRVTIQYYLHSDGSAPDLSGGEDGVDDYEQQVAAGKLKPMLPPKYSDPEKTELKAEVSAAQPSVNFDLQSK